MGAANWSFNMYPGLSIGCINTLLQFGTDAIKTVYLPRLVAGTWTGTMCLTEPQCGTGTYQRGDADAAGAVSDGLKPNEPLATVLIYCIAIDLVVCCQSCSPEK